MSYFYDYYPDPKNYKFIIKNDKGKVISKGRKENKIMMEKQKAGTKIYVYAIDQWGNKSKTETVEIKDGVPPKFKLNNKTIYNSTNKITGTGEPKAKVEAWVIYDKKTKTATYSGINKKIGETIIDSKGKFEMKIPKRPAGQKFRVIVYDKELNASYSPLKTIKDNIPPAVPKVKSITSKSTKLTGTSEKNSIIYVYNKNKFIGNGTTNTNGQFFVKIPKLKKGTKLLVSAMDDVGNESKARTVVVK